MNQSMSKNILLIVEDSEEDFIAIERALKGSQSGIINKIMHCEDGESALHYLENKGEYADKKKFPRPNLILLDLNLPRLEGKELLKKIKSNEVLKHIPVIILTTSADEMDINVCYALGASSYVQKPVRLESFVNAIAKIKDYWFEIVILPKTE